MNSPSAVPTAFHLNPKLQILENKPQTPNPKSLKMNPKHYTRYNAFLGSLPTAFHQQLCLFMDHKFLSAGLEAYYAGDNHSTVYIIVTGVVRVNPPP